MKNLKISLFAGLILIIGIMSNAQTDEELFEMSLEELMNIDVTVASKSAISIRETPGIVTVITEEQLKSSGAVDLLEVLRLVPGFENGADVIGATGMTLRGNYGYGGRVLLMIDGQEVNELFYSCTFSDNHYLVDNIKKIEIIRGPGSAIYGGFAELGVINIITKNGADLNGFTVTSNYGQMSEAFSHRSTTFATGKKINDDLMFSLSGTYSQANRSQDSVSDYYGGTYSMKDNSLITSAGINANANYKGLDARFIMDDYVTNRRDQYDENLNNTYDTRHKLILGELKYDIKLNEKLTLTPKYNLVYSVPWQSLEGVKAGDTLLYGEEDYRALRNKINLTLAGNLTEKFNLVSGVEFVHDKAKDNFADFAISNSGEISFYNISGYAQGILQTNIVNVTLGARMDNHSKFGLGFAPRLAFTKVYDKFHSKLLFSQAFRAPSIMEMDAGYYAGNNVTPEIARVAELELGYMITSGLSVTANAFYNNVKNSIVYFYDVDNDLEGYVNSGVSGTWGLETEIVLRQSWGFANLNYSFYSPKGINEVDYYGVMVQEIDNIAENQLIGTSPHKIALNSKFKVYKGLSINPSATFIGKRYAYDEVDADWFTYPTEQDAMLLVNLFINYKDIMVKGLDFGIGIHNILDQTYKFVQIYNGWHAPIPGEGRRISARLVYDFNFKD